MENNYIFGHKPGLFLLFFTEMWERFSYYGMRALLTLFLVSELAGGGWGWSREDALQLYALYTGLVYLTPILGGIAADKLLGYRGAVILGALLMTLGHGAMALETSFMFYAGLGLLILGNGFFKPNISSIVGQLYADEEDKKDAAYTIFYMGINAGAFLGILLCGYVGEKVGWSFGFGLAGIFMFLGMVMFQLGQSLFGELGQRPSAKPKEAVKASKDQVEDSTVVRDRLIVIGILSFSTIFFWWAFEQAGGSMTIFAKDYTGRVLSGSAASIFFWVNTALTIVPLAIVTFVLVMLVKSTYGHIPFSNISIVLSFVIIWLIAIWMLNKEFKMKAFEVTFKAPVAKVEAGSEEESADKKDDATNNADDEKKIDGGGETAKPKMIVTTIQSDAPLKPKEELNLVDIENKGGKGKLKILTNEEAAKFDSDFKATVLREIQNETEVPASWFGILNSFFIIAFAPLFSKIWESRWNPSAPVKFGIGLILLGLGFGVLAIGSMGIDKEAKFAAVSIWWLVAAYMFHTLGELCVSPVGLSYVSKLAPLRLVGLMFGVWFGATAIANYLAGFTGSYIDRISENFGLSTFFLIFTAIPVAAGIVMWALNGWIKEKMHGIE
jgi:POT family proton-dependent oligopeptide transporter